MEIGQTFTFHVKRVTFDTVQEKLYELYLQRRASPKYLFLAHEAFIALDTSVKEMVGNEGKEPVGRLLQIANGASGQMVHLIELPEASPQALLFGFFSL
jgi:hypothetical protein